MVNLDLSYTDSESTFRDELRGWLADNPIPVLDASAPDGEFMQRREWQRRLASGGWTGVHWPVEYGGRGASVTESAIFFEELAKSGAPLPANVLGLLLAGPTVLSYGTDEQKDRYLPPILDGREIWCQGFSEPGAGSDLAAVSTRAEWDGNCWVISGQKVWTSYAQHSKWCMLLARTDRGDTRHKGLTYFLLDMELDGVLVRPIREMTGDSHFNEIFLEEVKVPNGQVLDDVGQGWQVAMATLMSERAGLAFFHQVKMRQGLDRLISEAEGKGLLEDSATVDRLGGILARIEALRLTAYRGLAVLERDGRPGPEGSIAKLMWSAVNQDLAELAVDIQGPAALADGEAWGYELMRARGNSIEGGTTEIQKNILAERVLGLPRH